MMAFRPNMYRMKNLVKKFLPLNYSLKQPSLCASGSEARRLIEQGGAYINNKKVEKFDELIKLEDNMLLRAGKKKYKRIKNGK